MDLLDVDEDIFHFYDKSDLPEIDNSLDTDVSVFDGFTFTWDPSSKSPGEQTVVPTAPNSVDPENQDGPLPQKRSNIRSILKSPSIYFSGDTKGAEPKNSGDFLDLCHSTSRLSLSATSEHPRKLRKRRLSGSAARPSALSKRKSMVSILSEIGIGKGGVNKTVPPNKYQDGCESSMSSGNLNLPKGIVHSGRGIGFTCASHEVASRSRLSLSSMKTQTCFKSILILFGRHRKSPENLPRSRNDVMQQIYGSTWSIHTNEAQMSTGTFGIPDGLGRRVDSIDLQQKTTTTT